MDPFDSSAQYRNSCLEIGGEDDLDFLDVNADDYGAPPDDDELEDYDDQPRRRSKSTKGKSKKKSRKRNDGSGQVIKILAVVLVVVLVIGGGGYGMVQLLSGSGSSDLDWLPTEAQGFVKVRVNSLWNANLLQAFKNSKPGQSLTEEMTKNLGKGPQDLDAIVTAIMPTGNAEVVVFRAKQPFDLAAIKSADSTLTDATHGSATYLKGRSKVLYMADPTTLVIGPEAAVQAVIARGKTNPSAAKFGFARGYRDHLVVAMLEPGKMSRSPMATSPFMGNMKVAVPQTALIRANAGSDIDISGIIAFNTAEESRVTVEKNKADLEKAKADFAKQKATLLSMPNPLLKPDQVTKMINAAEQVMNSVQMSQSGSRMNMSAKVSSQAVNDVASIIEATPMGNSPAMNTLLPTGR